MRLFDVLKGRGYNPYRGAGGRFTSGSGGSAPSASDKEFATGANQRHKERKEALEAGVQSAKERLGPVGGKKRTHGPPTARQRDLLDQPSMKQERKLAVKFLEGHWDSVRSATDNWAATGFREQVRSLAKLGRDIAQTSPRDSKALLDVVREYTHTDKVKGMENPSLSLTRATSKLLRRYR